MAAPSDSTIVIYNLSLYHKWYSECYLQVIEDYMYSASCWKQIKLKTNRPTKYPYSYNSTINKKNSSLSNMHVIGLLKTAQVTHSPFNKAPEDNYVSFSGSTLVRFCLDKTYPAVHEVSNTSYWAELSHSENLLPTCIYFVKLISCFSFSTLTTSTIENKTHINYLTNCNYLNS